MPSGGFLGFPSNKNNRPKKVVVDMQTQINTVTPTDAKSPGTREDEMVMIKGQKFPKPVMRDCGLLQNGQPKVLHQRSRTNNSGIRPFEDSEITSSCPSPMLRNQYNDDITPMLRGPGGEIKINLNTVQEQVELEKVSTRINSNRLLFSQLQMQPDIQRSLDIDTKTQMTKDVINSTSDHQQFDLKEIMRMDEFMQNDMQPYIITDSQTTDRKADLIHLQTLIKDNVLNTEPLLQEDEEDGIVNIISHQNSMQNLEQLIKPLQALKPKPLKKYQLKREAMKRHFQNYSNFISENKQDLQDLKRVKDNFTMLSPKGHQLRNLNLRRNQSISQMAQLIRNQNKSNQVSVEQIIQNRDSLEVPSYLYKSIQFDNKAPNFLNQERHRHVFETQARTQQRFLDSKYGEFGRDKEIKMQINSKFDIHNKNIERLAAPLLSPQSFLSKFKKFEGIDLNKNLKVIIEKYQQMGFENRRPSEKTRSVEPNVSKQESFKSPSTLEVNESYQTLGAKMIKLELNPYSNFESFESQQKNLPYQGNFNFMKQSSTKHIWTALEEGMSPTTLSRLHEYSDEQKLTKLSPRIMKSRLHLPKLQNKKSIQIFKQQENGGSVPNYRKNILKNVISGEWQSPRKTVRHLPKLKEAGNQAALSTQYSKVPTLKNYHLSINNSTVYNPSSIQNSPKKTQYNPDINYLFGAKTKIQDSPSVSIDYVRSKQNITIFEEDLAPLGQNDLNRNSNNLAKISSKAQKLLEMSKINSITNVN